MKKKLALALFAVVVIVGLLAGGKTLQIKALIDSGSSFTPPPEIISSIPVQRVNWESILTAVGSAEASQGVTVTADLPGRVAKIRFKAGSEVKAGDVLLEQDTAAEQAQLRVATTSADLAKKSLDRISGLWDRKMVSQSQYDTALADHTSALAQVDNLQTNIEKRIIRAPFDGRLGIRQVNLGQDINEGQAIVSLQAADLMFVNFSLPQKQLSKLRSGLKARAHSDAAPNHIFEGVLTTVSPEIDPATRTVKLQATFANNDNKLTSGMFARVEVVLDGSDDVLVVPSTAVSYATFGDSVFLIEPKGSEQNSAADEQSDAGANSDDDESLIARQQFIRLGKARGDFVVIEKGLGEGDVVAATGVFKLQNGAAVTVDNSNRPDFQTQPNPSDS